jgi:hypothetical protein
VNLAYEISVSYCRDVYHAVKSYEMGPTALLPLRRKSCYRSIALKHPSFWAVSETVNLGSNDKTLTARPPTANTLSINRLFNLQINLYIDYSL